MDKSAPWIVALLETFALYLYADKIWKNEVEPSFMTWIIFLFGICVSLGSYILNEKGQKRGVIKKLLLNPMNACDVLVASIIIIILIEHNGWTDLRLTLFDFACLITTFLITAVWIWRRNHFYIFLVTQLVMVIAYFPTIRTLIVEGRNTESFASWSVIVIANVIALIPARKSRDPLAQLYPIRAIAMVLVTMAIMFFAT